MEGLQRTRKRQTSAGIFGKEVAKGNDDHMVEREVLQGLVREARVW